MQKRLVDTNIILRFLVEDPESVADTFRGVFSLFPKIEAGEVSVFLLDLGAFEAFFLLRSTYRVPQQVAARKLLEIVSLRGVILRDKDTMVECLKMLETEKIDLVDAYLLACAKSMGIEEILSFDSDLANHGVCICTS